MPCAVKSSLKPVNRSLSRDHSYIGSISLLTKIGCHPSNRRSFLSESELNLWGLDFCHRQSQCELLFCLYRDFLSLPSPILLNFESCVAISCLLYLWLQQQDSMCRAVKPALWCTQTCSGPASLQTTLFSL
jgi:hypothetical protein